jgi:hypothetical protein
MRAPSQSEIEQCAEELYTERGTPQGPPWKQLGDVTKSVWFEIAEKHIKEQDDGDL